MDRIEIKGNRFSSLHEFYDEIESQFTKDLDWKIGHNLDAFNDVLRGGFGIHDYDEPILIVWTNSNKSKADLGFNETIKYIESKLNSCHPPNRDDILTDLELAKKNKGTTLFDTLIEIIEGHEHISLRLE